MTAESFLYLLGLLVLILLSGFFSGSETALFSINRIQLKRLEKDGDRGERTVGRLLRRPQRLLSTVVVGNMLVNVLFASLIATLTRELFREQAVSAAIIISTGALLLFGEVAPKTVAIHHGMTFSRLAALPLAGFSILFSPLRKLLQMVAAGLLVLFRQPTMANWDVVTREEVTGMMALGQAAGVTTERERMILDNILGFGEIAADDIMIPRNEVEGLEDSLTVRRAFAVACRLRHSLVPVYHNNMDDVWGVFSIVEMPRFLQDGIADKTLASFREQVEKNIGKEAPELPVYSASVFPESVRLDDLLTGMKELRISMAVLLDEYGGTAGILTVRDLLEEIVGRLSPGRDDPADDIKIAGDYVITNGRLHIRDFNKRVEHMQIAKGDSDTIGGHVMECLGRLPRAGDTVEDSGLNFKVMRMAGRRIGTLRIEKADGNGEGNKSEENS